MNTTKQQIISDIEELNKKDEDNDKRI